MKPQFILALILMLGLNSIAFSQESPAFVVSYFDVEEAGDTTRYYSQIIPLSPNTDMECVEDAILNSFKATFPEKRIIFWKIKGAPDQVAADNMVVTKLTIPGRKRGWFKAQADCQ